jgi:hypothetical protein
VAKDGSYDFQNDWPIRYLATIGNGQFGTIVEGPNQGNRVLNGPPRVPSDGDVLDFTSAVVHNPASKRNAVLNIDVWQENGGQRVNPQSFVSDEEAFDDQGRAFPTFSLLLNET